VRWLSLRAVALSGVLEEPLVGGIGNILSQTIREYGLIRRHKRVRHRNERGATRVTTSVNPKQSTEMARRLRSLRAVLCRCQVLGVRSQETQPTYTSLRLRAVAVPENLKPETCHLKPFSRFLQSKI
jgi:hypothetical protein